MRASDISSPHLCERMDCLCLEILSVLIFECGVIRRYQCVFSLVTEFFRMSVN